MSKSQGDGYKTWTNEKFNEYKDRLNTKLCKLIDEKISCEFITNESGKEFLIICVQGNEINNPNGRWKWDGWEITGRYYRLSVYQPEAYTKDSEYIKTFGTPRIIGLPLLHYTGNNKDEANKKYKEFRDIAKTTT